MKRVDFPTLGRPTMPAFKLMLIFVAEDDIKRLRKPMDIEGSATVFRKWREKNGDFNGRDTAGIR